MRTFLALKFKTAIFKGSYDVFGTNPRQAAPHTYAMIRVRTVTPSDTGSSMASSGMSSPFIASVSR